MASDEPPPPASPPIPKAPAGWYPDPDGKPGTRYFDGFHWTNHFYNANAKTSLLPTKRDAKLAAIVTGAVVLLIALIVVFGSNAKHSGSSPSNGTTAAAPATSQGPKPPANVKTLNVSPQPGPNVEVVTARYHISDNLTQGLTKDGARIDTVDILKYIKAAYPNLTEVHVFGTANMVDKYGRTSDDQVLTLTYSRATMDKINFDNVSFKDIWDIADFSWVHPAFQY